MTDQELIYSAGWVPCDRIQDAITEAKTSLEALWPKGGNAPDRRDVLYLLDSLKMALYKRAEKSRVVAPPAPKPGARSAAPTDDLLDEARAALGTSAAAPQGPAATDSRSQYQAYRSGLQRWQGGG